MSGLKVGMISFEVLDHCVVGVIFDGGKMLHNAHCISSTVSFESSIMKVYHRNHTVKHMHLFLS